MAVRIRMTRLGRRHRPYFRIVATDSRTSRDGKYLEDLGTYDPMVRNADDRVTLKPTRVKYWLGVGAKPTEKVAILLKKYMEKAEKAEAEADSSVETSSAEQSEETPAPESS